MQNFEWDYMNLVEDALAHGGVRQTRNGRTKAVFGRMLEVPLNGKGLFPIIQGRKMYPDGVLGELAAMLRKPTCLADFEAWGCNYWGKWANGDGSIYLDYGNAWHADGQIERLKECLANKPYDRRMIINGWRPERLKTLNLPCCHLMYQFFVRDEKYLDMMWTQRSVDLMIGLPSDIIFAAAWLIAIANEFGYTPGTVIMSLGDCHIYEEHYEAAEVYSSRQFDSFAPTKYELLAPAGKDFCQFEPTDIKLINYTSKEKMILELKA